MMVRSQATRGFACIEHLIELLPQLIAKRRLLAIGLLRSCACLLRLCLGGDPRGFSVGSCGFRSGPIPFQLRGRGA